MAESSSTSPVSAKEKYYFLLRRLHSLSGIVPIGAFLCFHLTINATILCGSDKFNFAVDKIHLLEKLGLLVPVEIATIFVPILFHAIFGLVIVFTATPNATVYRYGPNIRYTLQRVTGVIAFIFIFFHLWQMHKVGRPFGGGVFDPGHPTVSAATALQSAWWYAPFYALGVVSSVYHFANGVWTALITWGITIGPRSQRITGYFCAVLGIAVSVMGLGAVRGFKTFDTKASAQELAPQGEVVAHVPADHTITDPE